MLHHAPNQSRDCVKTQNDFRKWLIGFRKSLEMVSCGAIFRGFHTASRRSQPLIRASVLRVRFGLLTSQVRGGSAFFDRLSKYERFDCVPVDYGAVQRRVVHTYFRAFQMGEAAFDLSSVAGRDSSGRHRVHFGFRLFGGDTKQPGSHRVYCILAGVSLCFTRSMGLV
jgi:hypothetical protein